MVGSLFNTRVFQADDTQEHQKPVKGNAFIESDSEGEDCSPAQKRANRLEKCLQQRIFYSERLEKIEKILLNYKLIPKDIFYCSQEQLKHFCGSFNAVTVLTEILGEEDDMWFEIYKSVAADKNGVDKQIE